MFLYDKILLKPMQYESLMGGDSENFKNMLKEYGECKTDEEKMNSRLAKHIKEMGKLSLIDIGDENIDKNEIKNRMEKFIKQNINVEKYKSIEYFVFKFNKRTMASLDLVSKEDMV